MDTLMDQPSDNSKKPRIDRLPSYMGDELAFLDDLPDSNLVQDLPLRWRSKHSILYLPPHLLRKTCVFRGTPLPIHPAKTMPPIGLYDRMTMPPSLKCRA
jgi:hypothetical protein